MNHRASFLILTAVTEVATGILLIVVPSIAFSLLLEQGQRVTRACMV
jgi:hypothetical protein